ncbi:MAG: hypothetical protein K2X93_04805 [Candidatus Obscuribacterales bacterium]|nr:hypothetical protein [Candidatus Obscuribacterales bacterium]
MKLQRSRFVSSRVSRRMLIGASIFGALIAAFDMTPSYACGPFAKLAQFAHGPHPDYPLQRYAAGELGIVRSSFARSYLALAYRYLSGHKTSARQQNSIYTLWQRRLATPDSDSQNATTRWLSERGKVKGAPLKKDIDVYSFNNYSLGYLNYPPYAFDNATEILKKKIGSFGVTDSRVVAWAVAQDKVFGVGADAAPIEPLPAGATPEEQADRTYQIACKSFYDADFASAVQQFEKIAQDKASPWQKWGSYLAARALCRKGTTGEKLIVEDLKHAKTIIDNILKSEDLNSMHKEASRLASFIECKIDPQQRAKEVIAVLTSDKDEADMGTALGDYTVLLDRILAAEQEQEAPNTGLNSNGNTISIGGIGGDTFQRSDASKPTHPNDWTAECTLIGLLGSLLALMHQKKARSSTLALKSPTALVACLSVAALLAASCSQSAHSVPDKNIASNTPSTTSTGANEQPPKLVLDDDMTKWIYNMEGNSDAAQKEAYDTWKQTGSLPWLVATVNAINASSPYKDEVLQAASKIEQDSPAYLTLAYHRIRILKESGKTAEAIKLCQSLLSLPTSKLPPSSHNLIIEQYTPLVTTLSEFAKIAAPSPAAIVWDYDIAEIPEPVDQKKTSDGYVIQQGRLTPEAAEILNELAPLSTTSKLATDPVLPEKVRLNLAQAGWVRSILLKDDKAAMALSPVLRQLRPQLTDGLNTYEHSVSPNDKELAAYSVILHNPAMRPYVTSGLERETAFDKIDSYRDNWWCEQAPSAPVSSYSPTAEEDGKKVKAKPTAAFLSKEDLQQGSKQFAGLKATGTAPNFLAQKILTLAKGSPADSRVPELLHIVVSATRYGCTNDSTTGFSKQAFQLLHSKYPSNPWTKKTKYWF